MADSIQIKTDPTPEPDPANVKVTDQNITDDPQDTSSISVREGDQQDTQDDKPDRPEWLPEKFDTPEAMAEAYAELEKKQSEPAQDDEPTPADDDADVSTDIFGEAQKEFAEKGELSDKTYEAMAKAGVTRETVDRYIEGQQAIATSQSAALAEVAGGEESLRAIIQWAGPNLSEAEAATYNHALDSGNMEALKLAFQGVMAKYSAAVGQEPGRVNAPGQRGPTGAQPYGSTAEILRDMGNPLYKSDPVFRKKVEQRMAVTQVFGHS